MRKKSKRQFILLLTTIFCLIVLGWTMPFLSSFISPEIIEFSLIRNDVEAVSNGDRVLFSQNASERLVILRNDGSITTTGTLVRESPRNQLIDELSRLNSLKSDLTNQLEKVENSNLEQEAKEIEATRIQNQVDILNKEIDSLTANPEQNISNSSESENRRTILRDLDSKNADEDSAFETYQFRVGDSNQGLAEFDSEAPDPDNSTPDRDDEIEASRLRSNNLGYLINVLKWFSYFIATVLGILFKALWESPSINALLSFKNVKPVLIAPIVFYGVYATVNTLSDDLLAILIAFQNGFFWQSILKAEEGKLNGNLISSTADKVDS